MFKGKVQYFYIPSCNYRTDCPGECFHVIWNYTVFNSFNLSTPSIIIHFCPNTFILAPILLSMVIKSIISGRIWGFQTVVVPEASVAVKIAFSVAPVDRSGKSISHPFKRSFRFTTKIAFLFPYFCAHFFKYHNV